MQVEAEPEAVEVDEQGKLEAWRLHELLLAGYTFHRASQIAGRHDVDLHVATWLLEHGCDQKLALKILL